MNPRNRRSLLNLCSHLVLLLPLLVSLACNGGSPSTTTPGPKAGDILGTVWRVQEGMQQPYWQGTWTRRGTSNVFDGVWKSKDRRDITGEVQIDAAAGRITARRTKGSDGINLLYSGTFTAPGTASGVVVEDSGKLRGSWSATIEGAGTAAPPVAIGRIPSLRAIPPAAGDEAEARYRIQQVLRSFDLTKPETLDAVENVVSAGRLAVAPLVKYLTSDDLLTRWMAVYGLSRLAEKQDLPGLVEGLKDANPGLRAKIAATLLRLGDERGVPVLREAATSTEALPFSEPPRLLRDYASEVLRAYGKMASLPSGQDAGMVGAISPGTVSTDRLGRDYESSPALPGRTVQLVSLRLTAPNQPSSFPPPKARPVLSIVDGQVQYTLFIEFYGPGIDSRTPYMQQRLVERYANAVEAMWSNRLEWEPGRPVSVKVYASILRPGDAPTPWSDPVRVVTILPGQDHRSNSEEWADSDSDLVIGHEGGHLLGIPDEYRNTADGKSMPKQEYFFESQFDPSIMVQTWDAPNGHNPGVKPRHSDWAREMALRVMRGQEWRGWEYPSDLVNGTSRPVVTTSAIPKPPTSPAPTPVPTRVPTTVPATAPTSAPTSAPVPTTNTTTTTTTPPTRPPTTTTTEKPTLAPTLTPARDLTGTWKGSGIYYYLDYDPQSRNYGRRVWKTTTDIELRLTQTGSRVTGQVILTPLKGENTGVLPWFRWQDTATAQAVNGTASITNLYLEGVAGDGVTKYTWTFTFTTDLMSGGVKAVSPDLGSFMESEPKAFSLVRQK